MEYTSTYKDAEEIGHVQVSEEVIAVIAGIAATEVKGVASLAGNLAMELITKIGIKMLSRGVKISMIDDTVAIVISVNVDSAYQIPVVCRQVQEKVANAVETMIGMTVSEVDVMVDNVVIRHN